RDRVVAHGGADGAGGAGPAGQFGELAVGDRLTPGNLGGERLQHGAAEAVDGAEIQGELEMVAAPGEPFVELAGDAFVGGGQAQVRLVVSGERNLLEPAR